MCGSFRPPDRGVDGIQALGRAALWPACLAMELDPAYVDVAAQRWQAFTGQRAVPERGGRSFEEIRARRVPLPALHWSLHDGTALQDFAP